MVGVSGGETGRDGCRLYDRGPQGAKGALCVSSGSSTMTSESLEVLGTDGRPERREMEELERQRNWNMFPACKCGPFVRAEEREENRKSTGEG